MKKLISRIVVALCALILTTTASAKVKFGVKGGVDVSSMKFNNEMLDATNRTGWFAGPTMQVNLPLVGLGVDAAALYDQRSAEVNNEIVKQHQIVIPLNLRYSVGLGSAASAFVFAGPQWGFNVCADDFKWDDKTTYSFKKSNFSVNVGVGLSLLSFLQVSANYNIACGKTDEVSVIDAVKSAYIGDGNSWQVAMALYF